MAAQLYLVTPRSARPDGFAAILAPVVAEAEVAALLVRRHDLSSDDYRALIDAVLPIAQQAGTAVLVEDDIEITRASGADGMHVGGGLTTVRAAISALKPGLIVGAGPVATRHEAMTLGENDIDYLFFGSLSDPAEEAAREMAAWWAETFEVPAVLSGGVGADAAGCEFLAIGEALWTGSEPPHVLARNAAKGLVTA